MHLSHQRMASFSLTACAAWGLSVAPMVLPALAAAQVPDTAAGQSSSAAAPTASSDAASAAAPSSLGQPRQGERWFEPRITLRQTATTNARLNSPAMSDQLTELMPGFRLMRNTARVKGFADYTLSATHYARGTAPDKIWHNLNARGTVEAVDNRVYIDVDGMLGLQPISAFGPTGNSPANSNMAQTSNFRVSPYLRGDFSNGIDYEARYSIQEIRSDTASRVNATDHDWSLHLGKKPLGQAFGWGVDAKQQNIDYSSGRKIDTTSLRARLSYLPITQLRLTAIGGIESTNQLSPQKKSHNIVGFGVDWRPSDRTRLSFERESRYFGESHNANLEYRTARTVWRYTDRKAVITGLGVQSASMGSLFDLLDGFYSRIEPDPIRRMQIIQAEISRLGLPADMQVFQDFLASTSTLQRLQQLSLALLGQRTSLTLAASRSDTRRLDGSLQLGDDFNNNQRIRQHGWNIMLAHRLTPNSAINATFGDMRSIGSTLGWETRTRTLILGSNTLIAPRTNLGLQLRRVLSDGNITKYNESAIIGFVTHRF